jgi:superfamily II DNA or RNA helicase/HKD family nuclease
MVGDGCAVRAPGGSPSAGGERGPYNPPVSSQHQRGVYETLVTEALEARLRELDSRLHPHRGPLRHADAADRIALHLASLVRRVVDDIPDDQRVAAGTALARALVAQIDPFLASKSFEPGDGVAAEAPVAPAEILHALLAVLPDGAPETLPEPLIPLLDTVLLTNAPGEPRVGSQVLAEIHSADRVDVVMAFIRRSGIAPMLGALRTHCEHGRPLRVLTTTYTGSTEPAALDALSALGAEVRVSYDTSTTRLHAKAWLLHRASGFSTAYIGSSNLTHSAQVTGLEWNVRVSGARNPDVVSKVAAMFESYWSGSDFVPYDREEFLDRLPDPSRPAQGLLLSPIELRPEPFQERLLEQIALARELGHHQNLLVAATGTGKTVMAAIDYARMRPTLSRARLLFVAHREEILDQSLATFRHGLRDAAFGERWVAGERPRRFENVFASIQSLAATGFDNLARDHFDFVIIDEFHHAAARTYRELLDHVRPVELLGLTATPERSDGLSLLHWFGGRIAAELRLWDAIDQLYLCPFAYYGIHDGIDLREIPWRRGQGYDVDGLTNLFTANDAWARLVLAQLRQHVGNLGAMRALGFCVSIAHARFMARVFREAGVVATAVWGDSPDEERRAALRDLGAGRVNVVFSVDLFNEGVDVPLVDTLLLLRPTDSATLFLQQLGRGLRKSAGKTVCTVLDFVGRHRQEFRFDRRLRALLGGTRQDLLAQIDRGFPFLPAGCHLELDPVARDIVLANVRNAIPDRWPAKVEELRGMARGAAPVTLARYLEESGLEIEDVYAGGKSWSDLQEGAGLPVEPAGPAEAILRRACGRLLHVDDALRLDHYRAFLDRDTAPDSGELSTRDRRLLHMLVAPVVDKALDKTTTFADGVALLWAHPQVRAELRELCEVLRTRLGHVHHALDTHPDVPLRVHARYSRLEILAAFGVREEVAKVAAWQTGLYWVAAARADLLAFTLDKTNGEFSPTTRYRDYAISRELIHWESQSVTRAASETGRRYQTHAQTGSSILLFARLRQDDRAFWFLGPAEYVSHQGELPMAVTWKLRWPLPGDLFAQFAAAVA